MSANPALYPLHLYAFPIEAQPAAIIRVKECQFHSLRCPEAAIAASSYPCSFEQAVDRLQRLDRMFVEPDGYFSWTGHAADDNWQIDGMLYDAGQFLKRVELKGYCPRPAWQQLLSCFGWPAQPLLAHWIEWSCFVDIEQLLQSDFFLSGVTDAR